MDQWMNSEQAANHIGYSVHSLQLWRIRGGGPRYKKVNGRSVRYRESWLDEWMQQFGTQRNTSQIEPDIDRPVLRRVRLTQEDLASL